MLLQPAGIAHSTPSAIDSQMDNNPEPNSGIPIVLAGQKRTRDHPHSVANGLDDMSKSPAPKRFKPIVERVMEARRQNHLTIVEKTTRTGTGRPDNVNLVPPQQLYLQVSDSGTDHFVPAQDSIHASMNQGQVINSLYDRQTSPTSSHGTPCHLQADVQQTVPTTKPSPDTHIPAAERPIPFHNLTLKENGTTILRSPLFLANEDTNADVEHNAAYGFISTDGGPSTRRDFALSEKLDAYAAGNCLDGSIHFSGVVKDTSIPAADRPILSHNPNPRENVATILPYPSVSVNENPNDAGGFIATNGGPSTVQNLSVFENADVCFVENHLNDMNPLRRVAEDGFVPPNHDTEYSDDYQYGLHENVTNAYDAHAGEISCVDGYLEELESKVPSHAYADCFTLGNMEKTGEEEKEELEGCGVECATRISVSQIREEFIDHIPGMTQFEYSDHLEYSNSRNGVQDTCQQDLEDAMYPYKDIVDHPVHQEKCTEPSATKSCSQAP
ncbi:hypothetical protein FB446DRAFT_795580 [Lentinula raphanica]|nr:hypothetical protein FB446DRAFT_795580 [Lentinula raphanica]